MGGQISVIVPVFNTGRYLSKCVDSLLAQDYPEIEIILVDDGSTDSYTVKLCDDLAAGSDKINCWHTANGGSSAARNFGISKASGRYIGFVDSDDYVDPEMYSTLYDNLKRNNVAVSICELATEENGRLVDRVGPLAAGVYDNASLLHHFFLGHWHSSCTILYDRKLFETVSFPVGEANEDYLLNYLIFKEQQRVAYTDKVLYHYIRRSGSNTASPITLRFLSWLKHTEKVLADYGGSALLKKEAEYQYLYSNIVLGNKCLLTLAGQQSADAEAIYKTIVNNLRQSFGKLLSNSFLSFRNKLFGMLLAVCPRIYRAAALPVIRSKKGR
ncbi:MAG: glycosyltransferase family 2 protein [Bacteroidales bacterium]|nr:glycosyltransferase family 2 protein [Bacteroidales bacterium]